MRSVFFSFHYQRDIFRVNQIRNLPEVMSAAAAGFRDASIWEAAKLRGDAAVEALIDRELVGTSVTVVCIGAATAGRKFVEYEIRKSYEVGNGLLGIHVHHLVDHRQQTDYRGEVPFGLKFFGAPVYDYNGPQWLAFWIEEAARSVGR